MCVCVCVSVCVCVCGQCAQSRIAWRGLGILRITITIRHAVVSFSFRFVATVKSLTWAPDKYPRRVGVCVCVSSYFFVVVFSFCFAASLKVSGGVGFPSCLSSVRSQALPNKRAECGARGAGAPTIASFARRCHLLWLGEDVCGVGWGGGG